MENLIVGLVIIIILVGIAYQAGYMPVAAPAPTQGASTSPQPVAGTGWKPYNSASYIASLLTPKLSSVDGNIKYIGLKDTADQCRTACMADSTLNAYTWVDANGGLWSKQCYGLKTVPSQVVKAGYYSGQKLKENFSVADMNAMLTNAGEMADSSWTEAKASGQTFSNTLQRRLGMSAAGDSSPNQPHENFHASSCVGTFDCTNETFTSNGDIAEHTMWGGYQNRSVLP